MTRAVTANDPTQARQVPADDPEAFMAEVQRLRAAGVDKYAAARAVREVNTLNWQGWNLARKQLVAEREGTAALTPPSGSAVARWDAAVAEKTKAGMTRPQAIRATVVANPALHAEYMEANRVAKR